MSTHPLDPLTPEELARAVEVVRRERELGSRVRFIRVDLEEPAKPELRRRVTAAPRGRSSSFSTTTPGADYEGIVDLEAGGVERWTPLDGVQPAISADEFVEAAEAVRADPDYREALARRGITGDALDSVHIEPWSVGDRSRPRDRRLARALSWLRSSDDDVNPYARPIGRPGRGRRPERDGGRPRRRPRRRADPARERRLPRRCRRAVSRRPEAAGDRAAGRAQLRARRPRAALAEVANADRVREPRGPGAPRDRVRGRRRAAVRCATARRSPSWSSRTAIPARPCTSRTSSTSASTASAPLVNELELGCDCLGEIRYLDSAFVDTSGDVHGLRNAICIHEEDYGILWKHRDDRTARHEVPDRAAWWSPASRRSATTSTASTGTSTRTARSSSRAS